jgi:hypothetical protein
VPTLVVVTLEVAIAVADPRGDTALSTLRPFPHLVGVAIVALITVVAVACTCACACSIAAIAMLCTVTTIIIACSVVAFLIAVAVPDPATRASFAAFFVVGLVVIVVVVIVVLATDIPACTTACTTATAATTTITTCNCSTGFTVTTIHFASSDVAAWVAEAVAYPTRRAALSTAGCVTSFVVVATVAATVASSVASFVIIAPSLHTFAVAFVHFASNDVAAWVAEAVA